MWTFHFGLLPVKVKDRHKREAEHPWCFHQRRFSHMVEQSVYCALPNAISALKILISVTFLSSGSMTSGTFPRSSNLKTQQPQWLHSSSSNTTTPVIIHHKEIPCEKR